jgi:hypothetical protein
MTSNVYACNVYAYTSIVMTRNVLYECVNASICMNTYISSLSTQRFSHLNRDSDCSVLIFAGTQFVRTMWVYNMHTNVHTFCHGDMKSICSVCLCQCAYILSA